MPVAYELMTSDCQDCIRIKRRGGEFYSYDCDYGCDDVFQASCSALV